MEAGLGALPQRGVRARRAGRYGLALVCVRVADVRAGGLGWGLVDRAAGEGRNVDPAPQTRAVTPSQARARARLRTGGGAWLHRYTHFSGSETKLIVDFLHCEAHGAVARINLRRQGCIPPPPPTMLRNVLPGGVWCSAAGGDGGLVALDGATA